MTSPTKHSLSIYFTFFFGCLWALVSNASEEFLNISITQTHYQIETAILIPKKPCVVFTAITDFDHLSEFYPELQVSRITKVDTAYITVQQVLTTKILNIPVTQKVLLKVVSDKKKLSLEQITGDFVSYTSVWKIEPFKNKSLLSISTEFRLPFFKSLFVSHRVLRKKQRAFVDHLLTQVKERKYAKCE